MRSIILYLSFSLTIFGGSVSAQDLLKVEWEKTVCSHSVALDNVFDIALDDSGMVYTLGAFAKPVSIFGNQFDGKKGTYFLAKQKADGTPVFVKCFGGKSQFNDAKVRICKSGDILLGISYTDTCFINGSVLYYNEHYANAVLLKLDKNFNVLWSEVFRSNNATSVSNIVLDSLENIYLNVFSHDTIYNQTFNSKGSATIIKYDPSGNLLWWRNYHTGGAAVGLNELSIGQISAGVYLFLAGVVAPLNKVYFGSQLVSQNKTQLFNQVYLSCMDLSGNHLKTVFPSPNLLSIINYHSYSGELYFAGKFKDTIKVNNSLVIADSAASLFIAKTDTSLGFLSFSDLKTNQAPQPSTFIVSKDLGFLIAGSWVRNLCIQTKTISTPTPWFYWSYILTFDNNYSLKNFKYIEGEGGYRIYGIALKGKSIFATSLFNKTATFASHSNYGWNNDVATFRTDDFSEIDWGNFVSIDKNDLTPIAVFPNPSDGKYRLLFEAGYRAMAGLKVTDITGRILYSNELPIEEGTNDQVLEIAHLSSGIYFLQMEIGGKEVARRKLMLTK